MTGRRGALVLAAGLAACGPPPGVIDVPGTGNLDPTANGEVDLPTGSGLAYACDTGDRIAVTQNARRATVTLEDGTAFTLPRVAGAAANTYAGDGWIWFARGDMGVLTTRGGQSNCERAA